MCIRRSLNIMHGDITTQKRSKFQAHVARIEKEEQVKEVMSLLCKKNKIAKATHNIYAFRILNHDSEVQIQGKNDDGESGAGAKLLELLERENYSNVIVVVTRWFGGVKLGHDRFRLINQCALELLKEHM